VPERDVLGRLRAGEAVLSLGVRSARTGEIARLALAAGYDLIWIDLEHSSMSVDCATQIAATAADIGLGAWVRTAERDYGVIGRLLDGGADGIIAPRIETPDEARQVVAAARFPSRGQRSQVGLLPQSGYRRLPTAELMRQAELATSVHVLLETARGIANAEAIAAIDGVDALHVGVNDLSVDLGYVGDPGHAAVLDACRKVVAGANRCGKLAAIGGLSDPAQSCALIQQGAAPLIFAGIDTDLLAAGLTQRARQWRSQVPLTKGQGK
jgi:2-keto-3-deoxy-L-rhamnonate aldolase RhmA